MKTIILAAGMGTRLNQNIPKCLTKLYTGETILDRQLKSLQNHHIDKKDILIVVGYKSDLIKEKYQDYCFIENSNYKTTNTAKSLLLAIENINYDNNIIWLNGDVVFDFKILNDLLESKKSSMLVDCSAVGEEEVKYTLSDDGTLKDVSKTIKNGLGEAVGINKIIKSHFSDFKSSLDKCNDGDYFEKAIELIIHKGLSTYPIDISKYFCHEIDTKEDLDLVNKYLEEKSYESKR